MPASKKRIVSKAKPRSSGPSEIAPGVYVGGWKDAPLFEGARFCVLDEAPADMPPAAHIPIYDEAAGRANPQNLDRLAKAMRTAREGGQPVLVFCGHGIRRSPLGGAWYLRRVEGLSLDAAYDRVQVARPKVERPREWVGNAAEIERA